MSISYRILLLLLLTSVVGCRAVAPDSSTETSGHGELRFACTVRATKPQPEYSYTSTDITDKKADDTPLAEHFLINVISASNPSDTVFRSRYGDLPVSINLKEGLYVTSAEWGERKPFATDKPYYRAERECEISRRNTTDISLTASLVGFAVDLVYGDNFATSFSSYHIEAEINDVIDGYIFGANGTQTRAYFTPSTVRLVLRGTTTDGKPYSSIIKEITSPGKQLYTLRLNILPKGHTFQIDIDTSVEQIGVDGTVPDDLLPEVPPIGSHTFSYYETVAAATGNSTLTLQSAVGLDELQFSFSSPAMADLGLSGVMSTTNADHVAAMCAAGVGFEDGIFEAMADAAVFRKSTTVNFSALAARLPALGGVQTDYQIGIKVVDRLGKSALGQAMVSITPPIFTISEVPAGNVWTSEAQIAPLAAVNVVKGDFAVMSTSSRLKYQIREDGGSWSDLSSLSCTNLASNKTHHIRAIYGDTPSVNNVEFTTESPTQLPNSNMDNWRIENHKGTTGKMARYYPWLSGDSQFWDTNNTRTCSYGGPVNAYNSFPAVSYINAGRSGKAAELRSISASGSGLNSSLACADDNKTPGKLFIGVYKYNGKNSETITPGKEFASRPTAMNFYYQYEPWGVNDNSGGDDEFRGSITLYNGQTQIGYGEFKHRTADRTSITQWTKAEVQITYGDETLKADRIYVEFASSTEAQPKVSKKWERLGSAYKAGKSGNDYKNGCPTLDDFNYGGTMWQYYGSVLKIDDVELVYGK